MPYDTRRKSLSLPSLGIQLPNASRAHRTSLSKASPTGEHISPLQQQQQQQQQPPNKKIKRSHTSESSTPQTSRPRSSTSSSTTKNVSFAERPKSSGRNAYENTPPPSPGPRSQSKYDTDGIDDDIVVGVIEQLEKTGNRPHLIRELATVLSNVSDAVSSSANPGALLSSRLAAYLKRPGWTALAPCPLEKELTSVHPRKIYYYLTTTPRQELPADSSDLFASSRALGGKGGKRIISPSISSASVDEDTEAAEERKREALSPSPEVDLSSNEFDGIAHGPEIDFVTPSTPGPSFSGRSSLARDGSNGSTSETVLLHNHRAASPPLEGDEKEFTQTASSVRMRGMSLDDPLVLPTVETAKVPQGEEDEEMKAKANREAAEALFGTRHPPELPMAIMSSPQVRPLHTVNEENIEVRSQGGGDVVMHESCMSVLGDSGMGLTWDTREPEDIQIEDLDDLFGAC
ncbi:MAG: hypothetical protein Q9217_002928 [Psora testacea]